MAFCNMLKQATSQQFGASALPSDFNAAGFPATSIPNNVGFVTQVPDDGSTWVLKLPKNGGTGGFFLSNAITISAVGGTVNGVTYNDGGQTTGSKASITVASNQTQWRIVFTFNSAIPAGGLTIGFPTGSSYSNMSGLVLCRLSDEDAIDANPNALTPEWRNGVLATGASILRFMPWTMNSGNDTTMVSQWGYRPPTNAFTFMGSQYPSAAWAGSTSGTNSYTCGDTATPSLSAWVDGLTWQVKFVNASTATGQTISPNSLTAKPLVTTQGLALSAGGIAANTIYTCIYDAALDSVIVSASGMRYGPPVEVLVAICNQLNKHYWHSFPVFSSLSMVASVASYVVSNLSGQLNYTPEFGNETWNSDFQQYSLCIQRGLALGFPTTGNADRPLFSYTGLRTKQFAIQSAVVGARLKPALAFQAYAGSTSVVATYEWLGADLAPSGTSTGTGNSVYNSYTGSADYTSAPNRPVDACAYLSYATYYSGAQCCAVDARYTSAGAANLTGIKGAADDYASGNPTLMANALAFLDNDIRQGTLASSGAKGGFTLEALDQTAISGTTGIYPRWQSQYTTSGLSTQKFACYEGGLESWYPSTATATSIWSDASYGGSTGKIAVLLAAYKNNTLARDLVYDQCRQFMGLDPTSPNFGALGASLYPSWFVNDGAANQWSLYPLNPIAGNAYRTRDGLAAYNAS